MVELAAWGSWCALAGPARASLWPCTSQALPLLLSVFQLLFFFLVLAGIAGTILFMVRRSGFPLRRGRLGMLRRRQGGHATSQLFHCPVRSASAYSNAAGQRPPGVLQYCDRAARAAGQPRLWLRRPALPRQLHLHGEAAQPYLHSHMRSVFVYLHCAWERLRKRPLWDDDVSRFRSTV